MEKFAFLTCVAAAVLTVSAPALARDATPTSTEITAVGKLKRHHDWLRTWGPDSQGNFRASVGISDLDLSKEAGWAEAKARAKYAMASICRRVTLDARYPGYPVSSWHGCVTKTRSQLQAQLEEARNAARSGKRLAVAVLRLGQSPAI